VTHDGNELMFEWPGFSPRRVRLPVLNCYSAASEERVSLALLDTLEYCDRVHLGWRQAVHFDFQNWPVYSPLTGTEDPRGVGMRDVETGKQIYLSVCREVEGFLWTVFNGTEEEMAALGAPTPAKELPDSLPIRRFQPGKRVPFPEDIARLFFERKPEEARDAALAARERHADEAVLTTPELQTLASQLALMGEEALALDALRLGVDLDTLSLERRYLLAEELLEAGRTGEAVGQYQEILKLAGDAELDPETVESKIRAAAQRRLTELGWEEELPAKAAESEKPEAIIEE
jgi:hypothetical protein